MHRLAALRRLASNRPLAAFVVANGLSGIGDWLYMTALPLFVLRETGDIGLVGIVAAARLLPWFLLSIPAGIVADRFPRRRVLLAAEAGRTVCMLAMTALAVADAPLVLVLALAFGAVAAGTFALPAQGSLVPELANGDEELGLANTVSATFDNLANVVGPALAGLLVVLGGLDVAFGLNGLSFLLVVGILAWLNVRPIEQPLETEASPPESAAGWREIAKGAARPLTLDAAISFGAGALGVLPLIVADAVRLDGGFVGLVNAAGGLGGLAGAAVTAAVITRRSNAGIVAGVAVTAAGLAAMGLPAPVILVGAGAAVAGGLVLLDTLNITRIQQRTAAPRLGRTLGLLNTLAAVWAMAGGLVPALLASHLGVGAAVGASALVVLGLGAASVAPLPRLARRQRSGPSSASIPATSAVGSGIGRAAA